MLTVLAFVLGALGTLGTIALGVIAARKDKRTVELQTQSVSLETSDSNFNQLKALFDAQVVVGTRCEERCAALEEHNRELQSSLDEAFRQIHALQRGAAT